MGSDPQCHLEEQNFLIVGGRKIRENDWINVAERIRTMWGEALKIQPANVALDKVIKESERIFLSMLQGTFASPRRLTPEGEITTVPSTEVAIAWAELQRKLNNVGTTLSFSTTEARQREELFGSITVEVDRLRRILVEKGLL